MRWLLIGFLILANACTVKGGHQGNGEGFGGGDPLAGPLEAARSDLKEAIAGIKSGTHVIGFAKFTVCPDGMTLICNTLHALTPAQVTEVRDFIKQGAVELLALNSATSATPLVVARNPLSVTGVDNAPMEVMAMTPFGAQGSISVRDTAIQSLTSSGLLAIVAHEFAHKIKSNNADGSYQDDNSRKGAFDFPGGGRAKLDAVGAAIALYSFYLKQPADSVRAFAPAVWTGNTGNPLTSEQTIIWGGKNASYALNSGFKYDPATGGFTPMANDSAPSPRSSHVALWTGANANANIANRLIVWGGTNGPSRFGDGAIYDPNSNAWSAIASTNAPTKRNGPGYVNNNPGNGAFAVWTGTEMIVWGGWGNDASGKQVTLATGARYSPATNTWTATSTNGAPSARAGASMVWSSTTSAMLVWGGTDGTSVLSDGFAYDPARNTWKSFASNVSAAAPPGSASANAAPYPRKNAATVWTGTRMLIWGDDTNDNPNPDDGAIYDPVTDTWSAMSTKNAPVHHAGANVVWTGTKMVLWGGHDGFAMFDDGGIYDVANDSWEAVPSVLFANGKGLSPRLMTSAVWTGTKLVVWGGVDRTTNPPAFRNDGASYDPATRTWVLVK